MSSGKTLLQDLSDLFGIIRRNKALVTAFCAFLLGVFYSGSWVGTRWEEAKNTEKAIQSASQLAQAESDRRDALSGVKDANNEVARLRDLNEQKVCANFTVRERAVAVRRLQHALQSASAELTGRGLDPAGNELPLFQLHHYGLDGLDVTLFEDDDQTVQDAQFISSRIAEMNNLLAEMRALELTALSSKGDMYKSWKGFYQSLRNDALNHATSLKAHLDDRYKLPAVP